MRLSFVLMILFLSPQLTLADSSNKSWLNIHSSMNFGRSIMGGLELEANAVGGLALGPYYGHSFFSGSENELGIGLAYFFNHLAFETNWVYRTRVNYSWTGSENRENFSNYEKINISALISREWYFLSGFNIGLGAGLSSTVKFWTKIEPIDVFFSGEDFDPLTFSFSPIIMATFGYRF